MSISKLRIKNFKGIKDSVVFDVKPITLFIGANSSGKSSCIHAIAALAQSVKLPNSGRPLVLDDEYAQVHLGRYIEVIHSKKYTDSISIGFDAKTPHPLRLRFRKKKDIPSESTFSVDYEFKSTRRTQDIYLESLSYGSYGASAGQLKFSANTKKTGYRVEFDGTQLEVTAPMTTKLTPAISTTDMVDSSMFEVYMTNEQFAQAATKELSRVIYLGPFRQSPLRRYPTRGSSPTEVGAQGENTITLLANEHVQSKSRPHIAEVSSWLQALGLAQRVAVSRLGNSDMFDVQVQLSDGANLPIADLGYGMSQVLPVLAQCSFASPKSTLLFEQPELHLHTSSAKRLAGVFVRVQKLKDVSIVAETHSRELLIGILDEIREKRFSVEDLAVYTVVRKDGHSVFTRLNIEVDEQGRPECYDPWQDIL